MVTTTTKRKNTPARWRTALKRAHAEGVQVRQLAGSGMWIATSATDVGAAYEVTPWECECHAGQFGDPVCKHRAALLATFGRLVPNPDSTAPDLCSVCNGMGSHTAPVRDGQTWRTETVICAHCQGAGYQPKAKAA